ncbi:MAG: hypothetical protein C0169_07105 [Thermodesulfobacterium geofontis]|uniref:Uncharacterized protein n=1 Tax=Thermodesulfobacterium geofontis TaxID=1295609 RepID=A0A2N7Q791_9BACT|nr:MAG: hypothetical protein C0169_07105 [Thermodesulfobacterium geofontis]
MVLKFLDENSYVEDIENLLKSYVAKYPEDQDFIKLLLSFYIEKSAWEKSEKILKEYLENNKRIPELLFFLGYSLEKQNKMDEAIQVYEKLLSENNWKYEASRRIAEIFKTRDKNEAVRYMEDFSKRHPKNKDYYIFLANFAELLDLCEKGVEYAEEGIKAYPDDLDMILTLASGYACLEDYKKVLTLVEPLLKKYPKDPFVLNFVGYSYVELGKNLDEAEKLLLKALQINPLDPYILDSLGWCYYKKEDIDLAIQYLEKAVNRLSEDEAVIVEHLADAYTKKGDKNKACELYQRALKVVTHKRDKERIEKKFESCKSSK